MKSFPIEEHYLVGRDGAELRYTSEGRGLPVLILNGLAGPHSVFRGVIEHLSDRYRFLSWDYRGLDGASPPRSVSEHAADACAILEAQNVQRASLLGWSMGVQVALEVFHRAPQSVATLTLVNGGARASWASGAAQPLSGKLISKTLRGLGRMPRITSLAIRTGLHSPEAYTWARRLGLIGDQIDADTFANITRSFVHVDVEAYIEMIQRLAEHDATDVLRHIDVPTLVIAGDRDPFTPRAAMESLVNDISGAEYLVLPGAGHFVLLDHGERVSLRIEKFWSERGYRGESRTSVPPALPSLA
jgi:pimeloyl-ACP methyl ester carboxylesterase